MSSGAASCDPARLEADGPSACPPNAIMGYGSASVEVPLGAEIVPETATIALVAGPSENGYLRLLVCATGLTPVAARIVMPTLLIAGHLHITVPLVPSLPEGPDVAVVRAQVKLGGRLTYYEHAHGRTVAYHPKGVVLPKRCPIEGSGSAPPSLSSTARRHAPRPSCGVLHIASLPPAAKT